MALAKWIPTDRGRVLCILGQTTDLIDVDYKTAFAFAESWYKAAWEAERRAKGLGMTKREVDRFEEALVSPHVRLFGS